MLDAEFDRTSSFSSIEVVVPDREIPLSLFEGNIGDGVKHLSEIEIEQVISILKQKKDKMGVRGTPQVFEDLLSDLCDAQVKRAGMRIQRANKKKDNKRKKRCTRFRLNKYELKEILRDHYGYKEVRIESILAGSNGHNAGTIVLGYDSALYLDLDCSEKEEEEV